MAAEDTSDITTALAATTLGANSPAAITLPSSFKFDEVRFGSGPSKPKLRDPPAPLGVLVNFDGNFAGTGFNTIFRPNSVPPTTTTFPKPVQPPPPQPPNENVLELNLTTETLTFSSPLGNVPNRGFEKQNDIFLNGVSYVQAVSDVTNPATGRGDGKPTGIHFEPGLWMNVPPTHTNPVLGDSLVRMGSIPHGTTINAQCLSPIKPVPGPPNIPAVNITPFVTGHPHDLIRFKSQTASDNDTARIPQDLSKFIATGAITQAILDDPNTVLREANDGKVITQTITFTVSTSPTAPELGGGTANIAFLVGDPTTTVWPNVQGGPNSDAVEMTATFWIETVAHEILIPIFKSGQAPLKIPAPARHPGDPVPTFVVNPPRELRAPLKITVTSTQIQYSQTVFLNFGGLTWPHVSVATLVPTLEQPVPPSAWD